MVSLGAGTYWVSVQANQNLIPQGQWGWRDRSVQSNTNASWQNPGNGFGTGCTTWAARATTCIGGSDAGAPDQVYRLLGNDGAATAAASTAASTAASELRDHDRDRAVDRSRSTIAGINCDDCTGTSRSRSPVYIYGQAHTTAEVSSNGNIQFNSAETAYANECLPTTIAPMQATFFPYCGRHAHRRSERGRVHDDDRPAPNRVFYVEWRAELLRRRRHGQLRGRVRRERSGAEDDLRHDDER